MATKVEIPELGESITEAVIAQWHKGEGDQVAADEPLCELETDKANVDLPAPAAGVLRRLKDAGATVRVGEAIAQIEEAVASHEPKQRATPPPTDKTPPRESKPAPSREPAPRDEKTQTAARPASQKEPAPPKDRPVRRAPRKHEEEARPEPAPVRVEAAPERPRAAARTSKSQPTTEQLGAGADGVRRVPLSNIRRRIAQRLVQAQHTAAMLTTFNEIDMSAVLDLRSRHKALFAETHGVSLGLMSFFGRACAVALAQFPALNAELEGDDILYHDHVHLGLAVSTERGLVVPVLHDVESLSLARLEAEIQRVAAAAREGKLGLAELSGGTFTITNGGVFGSLLSTPILNPPQTGILGMHVIQKRPVVVNDRIRARPMMYVALTYDHRLVDGQEAVLFLVRIKELLEDPARMLLEI